MLIAGQKEKVAEEFGSEPNTSLPRFEDDSLSPPVELHAAEEYTRPQDVAKVSSLGGPQTVKGNRLRQPTEAMLLNAV
jgi:hypothetical protein